MIVFALYRYFPFGGLQRDMLRIAHACVERGVTVKILCAEWNGELPEGIAVERLAVSGFTNHGRHRSFAEALQKHLKTESVDLIVGFNKMPNLDIYYAADTCFKAKLMQERLSQLRFLPRYRQYLADEKAVFGKDSQTNILAIAQRSVDEYEQYHVHHKGRLASKPGITGLWQVSGRNQITDFEEIVELDTDYIMKWSVSEDIRIILKTVRLVVAGDGE